MRTEWRRFAPLGLYLAVIAALAAAGLYIVQREWNLYLQISLALIIVGLALFAFLDPDRVRRALTGRQARYGSNALILSIAFVGILAVANYLAYENTQRWDLTEDKQFTLSQETLDTLAALPQNVEARAFFTAFRNSEQARNLLESYQFHSDGKFDYRFIDPDADPLAAQQAEITQDGTIVLTMGDRSQQVTTISEQELTSALVRLISPDERKVYFLTGHGERSVDQTGQDSFSFAKRVLVSKNYNVESLNLLATNQIPEDARLIVIAGPQKPLSQAEVDLLSDYLDQGGALVAMEEPLPFTQFEDAPDPLASYLSDTWGVVLGDDIVVDLSSSQASLAAVGAQFSAHPVTTGLEGYAVVMPSARSVSVSDASTGASPQVLVSTVAQAWAETDLAALQNQNAQVAPDEGVDLLGPVPLAVAAENFTTNARMVVFGDSDFATDANFTAYGNADLFANAVDWAAGEEEIISLTPKETTNRLLLPPQAVTMNLLLLGTVIILPGLALVAGGTVWLQKRRRG